MSQEHTDNHQPNHANQPHNRQDRQSDPQRRHHVHGEPEEALVRRVDGPRVGVRRLKYPVAVAGVGVDLVPPPQTDEAASSDVLEVVEVDGEEDEGEDENEDAVVSETRGKLG
jgi:hypothetical protein